MHDTVLQGTKEYKNYNIPQLALSMFIVTMLCNYIILQLAALKPCTKHVHILGSYIHLFVLAKNFDVITKKLSDTTYFTSTQ